MKQWISLLLALVLSLALALPAGAAPPEQEEAAAWQLYYMGLFQGTDTDAEGFPVFSLDRSPTRAQGVTMLVRLLGQEEDALAGTWTTPFQDVPDWAAPYVGYAYEKGLTNGKSETRFDPDSTIRASEYLTFVLRALGYVSGTDFAWDSAWTLSDKLGITHESTMPPPPPSTGAMSLGFPCVLCRHPVRTRSRPWKNCLLTGASSITPDGAPGRRNASPVRRTRWSSP